MTTKYSKELLEQCVVDVLSFAGLARRLGKSPVGGTLTHLTKMCKKYNIDTSHFTGQGHSKGKPNFRTRKPKEEVLVLSTPDKGRATHAQLKRALLESQVEYKCACCECDGIWQGRNLTLHIDHINGQFWDHRQENLRFLCPNCHSQTETFGAKNAKPSYVSAKAEQTKATKTRTKVGSQRKSVLSIISCEEMATLLLTTTLVDIGKQYNVSSTAVRRYCKQIGVQLPGQGNRPKYEQR